MICLDMEKLLAGKISFDLKIHKLAPLLDYAIQNNKAYADEQGVSYVLKIQTNDVSVLVDEQRLQQVMANLLSNAAKFSYAGSEVTIRLFDHQQMARISVADQGIGIPQAFQSRVFEKFAQADGSSQRQQGGTGLGLSITRELVERMGGTISFTSEEGKGTLFYVDLPVVARE